MSFKGFIERSKLFMIDYMVKLFHSYHAKKIKIKNLLRNY
jgi:hypothetical protein